MISVCHLKNSHIRMHFLAKSSWFQFATIRCSWIEQNYCNLVYVLGTRAHFVCKYLHNISIVNTHISWYCWVETWWEHLPGTIWQSNSQNRREKERIGAMTNAPKSSLICSFWIQYSHRTVVTLYKYVTVLLFRFTTISENITNKFYTY